MRANQRGLTRNRGPGGRPWLARKCNEPTMSGPHLCAVRHDPAARDALPKISSAHGLGLPSSFNRFSEQCEDIALRPEVVYP